MTTKDIFWATKIGLEYLKSYEPNLGTTEEVAIGCIDTLQEILSKQIDRLDNNKLIDAKIISK